VKELAVLMITRNIAEDTITFKLEGKLLAPWRQEVERACAEVPAGVLHKRLDLSELTFVDAAGVDLLRTLSQAGFEITDCSNFVAALLHMEEI
jgi:hypothetical protein